MKLQIAIKGTLIKKYGVGAVKPTFIDQTERGFFKQGPSIYGQGKRANNWKYVVNHIQVMVCEVYPADLDLVYAEVYENMSGIDWIDNESFCDFTSIVIAPSGLSDLDMIHWDNENYVLITSISQDQIHECLVLLALLGKLD